MIWIILIAIIAIILIAANSKKESKTLSSEPFITKFKIVVDGLNKNIFKDEAEYYMKDLREHYLLKKSLGKTAYIQFINRENTLFLNYFEDFMEIKTKFSFNYSGTKEITKEQQEFIVKDFTERLRKEAKTTF